MSNLEYAITIQVVEEDGEFLWDVIQDFTHEGSDEDLEVLAHGRADSIRHAFQEAGAALYEHLRAE